GGPPTQSRRRCCSSAARTLVSSLCIAAPLVSLLCSIRSSGYDTMRCALVAPGFCRVMLAFETAAAGAARTASGRGAPSAVWPAKARERASCGRASWSGCLVLAPTAREKLDRMEPCVATARRRGREEVESSGRGAGGVLCRRVGVHVKRRGRSDNGERTGGRDAEQPAGLALGADDAVARSVRRGLC